MMHNTAMTRHVSKLLFISAIAVLALLAVVISPLFSFGQQAGAQSQTSESAAELAGEAQADENGNFFMPGRRVPQSQAEVHPNIGIDGT